MLWKKLVQFGKGFFDKKEESTSTDMPLGTAIHNIEITRGRGGQLARAAGAVAKLIAKEGKLATLRLPSGEVRLVSQNCLAYFIFRLKTTLFQPKICSYLVKTTLFQLPTKITDDVLLPFLTPSFSSLYLWLVSN